MKLHFESDLQYQHDAIEAVCDLFQGQQAAHTTFTVTVPRADPTDLFGSTGTERDIGHGNRLNLLPDELLKNLKAVQLRHGLKPSDDLPQGDYAFTVEMETGTGKTYVYLRTIFELNKRYGFSKFVIVVPSVAIKEGVAKSIEMMTDHFRALYDGVPFTSFVYDSAKLGQVRTFATSSHIQIMVVTVQAIAAKKVVVMYKDREALSGDRPIDLIRGTQPVVIVDEPQSVDGGIDGQGRQAIKDMSPLCELRYSATHADKHNMVYRLDAVDAYQQKLVKQIEVASLEVTAGHNKAFVRVVSVKQTKSTVTAVLELDVKTASGGVTRANKTVSDGDDLEQVTGRPVYAGMRVGQIRGGRGKELVEIKLPGQEVFLKPGEAVNDVDRDAMVRLMIRRTIKAHLDKELRLRPRGIKVLSLFFLDEVKSYRVYDDDGNPQKGPYAVMFEEEYEALAKHPDYQTLFESIDTSFPTADVHDGYFSIDKKGAWQDTSESNEGSRESATRAYQLIMRDKEKLLSFETPLKFIFSHSALREGWDNPNVFQICVLREMGTERNRRQSIGRGLRLCVNQDGDRVRGFEVNTLTVVATESYQDFADKLQKEIEDETGITFGVVAKELFANIPEPAANGGQQPMGFVKSGELWDHLKQRGYIDQKGKVTDLLRIGLKDNKIDLPQSCAGQAAAIMDRLKKVAGKLEIKNADERQAVKVRKEVLLGPDFQALWDRIKFKTTYRVRFDCDDLVRKAGREIAQGPPVARTHVRVRTAGIDITAGGVLATERGSSAPMRVEETDIPLPDILTVLEERTHLTRRTIHRIITESGRLLDFRANPQQFIELVGTVIEKVKQALVVDGIKYQKIGDEEFYAQSLFEEKELSGYLHNLLDVKRGLHEQVVYDSDTERQFAAQLDGNEAVKVFAKLPGWFVVPTPLGNYNPDWAVLVSRDGEERLYFVVETKPSLFGTDLRGNETMKIECATAHFEALAEGQNAPAKYVVATDYDQFVSRLS
jgi:type III restriction enzyme